jgi:hypothetical protein
MNIIEKLKKLDEVCQFNEPEEVEKHLVPIQRLSNEELADTKFHEIPAHEEYYHLPYLKPDGKPVGGFGKALCRCLCYSDDTAIAVGRFWNYDYSYDHEIKMSLDAKPIKKDNRAEMEVRFYLLGCKHEYEEKPGSTKNLNLFRTEHLHVCSKCDHYYVVDSSD